MKRLFAMLLALAMLLSLSVTAFAAEEVTKKGSITISNATPEKEYKIYKIFDATYSDNTQGKTAVAYKIDPDSKVFELMGFDKDVKTDENLYFIYNPETHAVTKKENVIDTDLIDYLTKLVTNTEEGKVINHTAKATAVNSVVEFTGLDMGYYVITSGLGTTVTITSNTPSITVIDKNQMPFTGDITFSKTVSDAYNGSYDDGISVDIGDLMYYKVQFTSTNYYEDQKIKYYQIHDEIGEAIWIDFESFEVWVDDEKLERGYYLNATGSEYVDETYNWTTLGNWGSVTPDIDKAQWYLVHLNENRFRITIPWLVGHDLTEYEPYKFRLDTPLGNASLYDTGDVVTLQYKATLESDAIIGGGEYVDMKNTAHASAICQEDTRNSPSSVALNEVYGIGILKDDLATKKNLAGAKFRLYRDLSCTDPVYVIPTHIDGVYIVDSLGKDSNDIKGVSLLPRQVYANVTNKDNENRLQKYLGTNTQDNYVVSQLNGKLVVLGLAEGNYYLKEVEAPEGYNSLTEPVPLTLSTKNASAFSVFANEHGEVLDDQFGGVGYTEVEFNLSQTTVHNSQGVELPSTGGEGTILLITIGTIVAMAFAVLMITQKKMSIYKD